MIAGFGTGMDATVHRCLLHLHESVCGPQRRDPCSPTCRLSGVDRKFPAAILIDAKDP
jgi:hypothetical protein